MIALLAIVAIVGLLGQGVDGYTNPCNQQKGTYYPKFHPKAVSEYMTITPFFSPSGSTPTLTKMVEEAQDTVTIVTPNWKSWIDCGDSYHNGCNPYQLRYETYDPLWVATLNAISRGVQVNVLSSYCTGQHALDPGLILPLSYLKLAGANVVMYESTTYMHGKALTADKKEAAISSINLSKSSMSENREAGMKFSGEGASEVVDFINSVLDSDLSYGAEWPVYYSYNSSDMAIIKDTTPLRVPEYPDTPTCAYPVPADPKEIEGEMDMTILTQPDYTYETFTTAWNATEDEFQLYIYVVNSWDWCHNLHDMYKRGVDVKILLSSSLVGDFPIALECYKWLYDEGMDLRLTKPKCLPFWHQKYWIMDNEKITLSSGNLDDYDAPNASVFPPITETDGVQAYRGFAAMVENKDVVSVYSDVFENDWEEGFDYYKDWNFGTGSGQ